MAESFFDDWGNELTALGTVVIVLVVVFAVDRAFKRRGRALAQRVAGGDGPARRRIVVDAAGYRERRAQVLERQADEAADRAVRSGRPVALDAMTSSERRVVHEYLRDRGDVDTHSEGDEPDRHLVVSPASGDDE